MADDAVPAFFGLRASPHEVGLVDLLAVARLRDMEPRELVALRMQPEVIEPGWEVSKRVAARLDAPGSAAIAELRRWGIPMIKRTGNLSKGDMPCTR